MDIKLGLAARVGGWSARHRGWAAAIWLLFVVVAATAGTMTGTTKISADDAAVGESARAVTVLREAGLTPPAAETVLLQSPSHVSTDPAFRAAAAAVTAAIASAPATSDVVSPYDSGAVSADGHSAVVTFQVTGPASTAADRVGPVTAAVRQLADKYPGIRIEQAGDASAANELADVFGADFAKAEWTAVPLALVILLVVFGSLVAAVVPVVLAVSAYVAAAGLVAVSSHWLPTSDDAGSVMLLVGLAVGVDYCLFYLRREREERAAGRDASAALTAAAATSGHAVLVSGTTVVVAMGAMFLTGIADFSAIAASTVIVVVAAVLGSLTALPAMLAMLGDRVRKGRVPVVWRLGHRSELAASRGESTPLWRTVLGTVLRRPVVSAVLSAGVLGALAIPAASLHTVTLGIAQELPPSMPFVQTVARESAAFPGSAAPATLVVQSPRIGDPDVAAALAAFRRQALATGQVFGPVQTEVHAGRQLAVVTFSLAGDGTGRTSERALQRIRGEVLPATLGTVPGVRTAVTGATALSVDFAQQVRRSMPVVLVFVLLLAFLLMLSSFRSLPIAVVTVALNLLSLGAAYGVLVLVFQRGAGAALVGAHDVPGVASWVPPFLFFILFGLSMDYHVFVLSRVKEGRDRGLAPREAIRRGVGATAGVVSSAALIMVGVFAIFGTLSLESMKQVAVGMAVAVLLDATLIRAVLLPAVLAVLGERAWFLPRWLAWVPELSHGAAPTMVAGVPVEEPDAPREPVNA